MNESDRAMLAAAIRVSPLGLAVLDRELRYLEINEVMARINGLERAAHLGRRMDLILPQVPAYILDAMRSVVATGQPRRVEFTGVLGQLGGPMTWVFELFPVPGPGQWPAGVCAIGMDVTDRRRLEAAEVQARQRVERMLERLSSVQEVGLQLAGAMTTGQVAQVLYDHATRVLGVHTVGLHRVWHDTNELELVEWRGDVLPPPPGPRRRSLDGEWPSMQVARTGVPVWLERAAEVDAAIPQHATERAQAGVGAWGGVPLAIDGRVVGVLGLSSRGDRTFELEDRAWLIGVAQSAAQAMERARAFEERERLLGLVGHDLRSPLTAITISAQLVKRTEDAGPRAHRAADRILASAARMDRITRDLLDYTEVRVGRALSLTRGPCDLGAIARRHAEEAEAIRPERSVEVTGAGDGRGEWDGERIGQVLANLIENAMRYGDEERPVKVDWDGTGEQVVVTVENEGPPIPAEVLPHLFEAFWRGGLPGTQRGLGLGLFIASEAVRSHGGHLEVHSGPEPRTAFTIRLPRR